MTTTENPGKRGPYAKTAQRRQQIVDEAYGLFASRGYNASSLRDVAAAAGMSQSNLLHHFGSKEELLLAVLTRRDELRGGEFPADEQEPFEEHIVRQAEANERIPGLIALYSVLSAEATTEGHPGRDYFLARYRMLQRQYEQEFETLRRAGRLREGVEPAVAAASVVALWEGIQLRWLYEPERIHLGDALRAYLDLLILGPLGADPAGKENGASAQRPPRRPTPRP
ncbi:TetR/AcrR family transcriptional regulator [Leifsonia poae]|uniref:TetR/AcrR family transcriptional regulator n=1 Tax=Leifsonia poae TaxID=110933 RepID=UPI003D673902